MDLELTDVGSSEETPESQMARDAPKELTILSLAQLKEKIAGNSNLESQFRHVPGTESLSFEHYDHQTPVATTRLNHRLRIGWQTDPSHAANEQAIWAYVHASPKSPDLQNQVSYYSDDNRNVHIRKVKIGDLHEPFRYIESLGRARESRGQAKLRFIVLMYFLEKGCIEQIHFPAGGFDEWRNAVAVIAKGMKDAALSPVRQASGSRSASQSSLGPKNPHEIGNPLAPTELTVTNVAIKPTVNKMSQSPSQNKREREESQDEIGSERGFTQDLCYYEIAIAY